jgi:type IV secretory pathway protease TraF
MLVPSRFAVTLTPSTDHRIFFLKNDPLREELEKGVYVMFYIRSEYIDKGVSHRVIKRIACSEDEQFSTVDDTFYCDGRKVAVAKSRSLTGVKLPRFFFSGKIPAGLIFVAGQHRDSYDSRYFGFLRKKEVTAVAYPLF